MRLLQLESSGDFSLTEDYTEHVPLYAILSHTWGKDTEEVTFDDFRAGTYIGKTGYRKIQFCVEQAARDGLQYFWVDSCCINKSNHAELSEAINSMFSWYRDAAKCYVYLSDVSTRSNTNESFSRSLWKSEFRYSRWFTRAWTLQELIAPHSVEFFSREGERLGDKRSLEPSLHDITGIPVEVLRGNPLTQFSVEERMLWAAERTAKRKEDEAYCLLGIFGLHMPLIYGEGRENAFMRLEEEIGKRSKGANIHGNVHWIVPRAVNSLFTGRSDLLSRIQKALEIKCIFATTKQRRFVITGLGGQGKSEICLQVASSMKQQFWGVFWVDVDMPSTAKKDFVAVAKLLGHSVESVPEALQVLATTRQSWLLILDNADDPEFDYQTYFPSGTHGAVLMTSSVAECRGYSLDAFEALGGLKEQDSKGLLLKAAGLSPELWLSYDNQAKEVVRLLGSHTLALIQAGAYISQGHCQLHQYPEVYRRQRTRLLKYRPKQVQSRYCDVYTTFEASANVLEQSQSESAKDALRLLQILSMLDSNVLTFQVFEEAWKGCKEISRASSIKARGIDEFSQDHVSHLPRFMIPEDDAWDSFRLTQAGSQLESHFLVTRHSLDGYQGWSMHPLTHAWAKDRQDSESQGIAWIAAGCVLGFSLSNTRMWQTQGRRLLPHVLSYLDIKVNKAFGLAAKSVVTPLFLKCGRALLDMRQDSRLGQLIQDTLLELGQNPRELSEEFLPLYDLQARNLMSLGRNKEAVVLLNKAVKMREITLAEDHPDRLTSQHTLARAYWANGQVAEAVALLEHVIQIREKTLAEDHPDRLDSQHVLAQVYSASGQIKESVKLLKQEIKIREVTLAIDHPDRLHSQHELAIAYRANGQVEESVALLKQVVAIRTTTLAETHPDRLASQHALAGAY
ncbi:related to calcium-independent phospholipase A2 [Phialocephala subalpina]|uniref:Related to calcium-independent phospholipase A2 n=1 Tax=Phialocephala subalpina TaxID=576137 RepID=A0A1L7WBT0_9HELO|nr:related to calcium-independent phospholipase A2 [Phialocephala subalpina]